MSNNDDLVIDNDVAARFLRCLSSDRAEDYNDWIQVCILFKNNFEDLYPEFDTWSKTSVNYNSKKNKKIWDGIKSKEGGLTVGTLLHWAKEDNKKEYNKVIQYMKHKEVENASEEVEDWYNATRFTVHKTWFKLNYPLKYCRYYNGEIQAYSPKEAQEFFKTFNIVQNIKGKEKTTYFFDLWSKDEFIKTYEQIVFDPENKDPKCFNTFTGFEMNNTMESECVEEFDALIKHIFKTEENINYFYSWINHIITKPHIKTGIAIILYSDIHGVGKNTIVELIMRLLGSKYCSKLNRIEDITSNFNAHLTQKLFIYGDEIRSRASDLASELKNIITQSEVLQTKKFMDSIKLKDLANYFFTTNEEIAFKIEQHNRRFFCIEVDGKCKPEFYKRFYEVLANDDKVEKFFTYIQNYKNLVDLRNIPETDYTKKLKVFSMNAVDHYLFNKVDSYQNERITVKRFYNIIVEYAKENRLPSNMSIKYVSTIISELMDVKVKDSCVEKKKFRDGTKFCFPKLEIMLEILNKYNSSYFENCGLGYVGTDSDDEETETNHFDI